MKRRWIVNLYDLDGNPLPASVPRWRFWRQSSAEFHAAFHNHAGLHHQARVERLP